MKTLLLLLVTFYTSVLFSQVQKIPVDTMVVTNHSIVINGQNLSYQATAGTQPVWNKQGDPIATLFYTYYKKSNSENEKRPIIFSFNGGPGSASAWMHIAYTGPVILNIDDEGYPVQPYGIKDNPNSILDVADIVYVNPVNTGYSRAIDGMDDLTKAKNFFGVQQDIEYLATWINTFVTRNNRWNSPKYLIGESYGTPRVSGLSLELQNSHWMYLNGVILVSPTGLGIERGAVPEAANFLPYYTAAAWFHKKLGSDLQSKHRTDILPEVEKYTIDVLTPAISKGGFLPEAERKQIAS